MNSRYKCHYLNISNASKPTEMEIKDQIDVGLGKVMFRAERDGDATELSSFIRGRAAGLRINERKAHGKLSSGSHL